MDKKKMSKLEKILDGYKLGNSDLAWHYYDNSNDEIEITMFVNNISYQPIFSEYERGEWFTNEIRAVLMLNEGDLDYQITQTYKISDSETWAGTLLNYDWDDEFSSEDNHQRLVNVMVESFPSVSRREINNLNQFDFKFLFIDCLIETIWDEETDALNKEIMNLINYVKKELNK